jgi:hypothetical protein
MNIKEAWAIVGGLSKPSKMPGYGYGLSAFECRHRVEAATDQE